MKHPFALTAVALLASLVALSACAASEGDGGPTGTGGVGASGGTGASGGAGGTGGVGGSTGGVGGSTGGVGGSTGGAAGSSGSGGGDGGGVDAGPTTTISGSIVGLIVDAPVTGMKVCVYQVPSIPCVTTSTAGAYALSGVPADAEVLLEYTKTDFLKTLVTVKTTVGPMSIGTFHAPTEGEANFLATQLGTTIDATKGQVLFTAFQGAPGSFTGQDNVAASIAPTSGVGPVYLTSTMTPSTSLTATSTAGLGLFANVSPGDLEVTMTHSSKTCQRLSTAWVGTAATASKVKIVAGYLTAGAGLECP
jgi:hypothetical protein